MLKEFNGFKLRNRNRMRGYWSLENLNQLHENINRNPAAADTIQGNVRFIWCEDEFLIAFNPQGMYCRIILN